MQSFNIHDAKTNLSKLVERAARGESFIIAKAGKPMVKVVPVDAPAKVRRIGAMEGQFKIPDDFDTMYQEEIETLFGGGS
ncbi:MAG: type II toxin-antitoxin system Phd/YefM family antitoxin [Candidatus Melainabacteria bacterium]|nr:type II toxin-antitoxin system Phd/YefM family antitoxin [Candidatus Melainabacteria bacterium]